MGTDGLFDNVFDEDLKPCLHKEIKNTNGRIWLADPTAAATCIGELAYQKSKDKRYESPFSIGAKKAGKWYMGGKEDDITVIVA